MDCPCFVVCVVCMCVFAYVCLMCVCHLFVVCCALLQGVYACGLCSVFVCLAGCGLKVRVSCL